MLRRTPLRLFAAIGLLVIGSATLAAAWAKPETRFLALCYHNIEDADPDQIFVGVTTAKLIDQLSWLDGNGYRFISVDDLLAARAGRKPLPEKAVLITFDDGYESVYTRAFPILKAFKAPAIVALTGAWMRGEPGDEVVYGEKKLPRESFLSWNQVREMAASGLVEIASHTEDLHKGIPANPQGNLEPAAVTRRYDTRTGYHSEASYRHRIDHDTEAMAATI